MPGFLQDSDLNDSLADELQKVRGSLVGFWLGVITEANQWAYNEILSRLVARGFTLAQVTAWDRGAEFQRDMGVWKCIADNAVMQPDSYNVKAKDTLDRRKELSGAPQDNIQACILTINGVFQAPQTTVGNPNNGKVSGWEVPSPLHRHVSRHAPWDED
jgi:hypothetical protein